MKEYKYVRCDSLENYPDWNIVKIIPHKTEDEYDMAVIMKEDTPKEDKKYIEHIKMQENELHNHLNIIDKINEIIDKVNGEDNE